MGSGHLDYRRSYTKRASYQGDVFGARYESYLTDPAEEPDLARHQTEVAIRLADQQLSA
jgi:hypothetical protein